MEVVRRREENRRAVIERAREWASSLRLRATAILVGSYARGDYNLWSDVDILLISDSLAGSPLQRLRDIDAPPGFQVIPITTAEFRKLLARRGSIAEEALRSGVFLRDDLQLASLKGRADYQVKSSR